MSRATELDRKWIRASKRRAKAILAKAARAREIADAWCEQGADRHLIQYLVWTVKEGGRVRGEGVHDSRMRPHIETVGRHLEKAIAELRRIPRLAFTAEYIGGAVLERLCRRIAELKGNLAVLGGARRPRGRPDEDHISRFMFVLSAHLRERTGRPHWREIAEFVKRLGLGKGLKNRHVQTRCLKYRRREPDGLERASEEARRFWEGS